MVSTFISLPSILVYILHSGCSKNNIKYGHNNTIPDSEV